MNAVATKRIEILDPELEHLNTLVETVNTAVERLAKYQMSQALTGNDIDLAKAGKVSGALHSVRWAIKSLVESA